MADYKPGDFFIGVIDFFGIMVPGAVLLYLRGEYLLSWIGRQPPASNEHVVYWTQLLIGSYLLGQILLGAGVPLNGWADIIWPERRDKYYREVKNKINLPLSIKNRTNSFYRAFSFVRLNSERAIAEIERQTAEYKLFRSLSLVFLFDLLLAWRGDPYGWRRVLASSVLFIISGARFLFLLNWTRRLTFEFYVLLKSELKDDLTPVPVNAVTKKTAQ